MNLTVLKLLLTGTIVRDRHKIFLSGVSLLLTGKSFKYLFKLAARMKMDGSDWIHKDELEPGINQAQYIYKLREELRASSSDRSELIENDYKGNYRLRLNSDEIDFDLRGLQHSEDFEIIELSRKLTVFYRNKETEDGRIER